MIALGAAAAAGVAWVLLRRRMRDGQRLKATAATEAEAEKREAILRAETGELEARYATIEKELENEREARRQEAAAAEEVQREVETLRKALDVEKAAAATAASAASELREESTAALARAAASEEAATAASAREAATRQLLSVQVAKQISALGGIAAHLAPVEAK